MISITNFHEMTIKDFALEYRKSKSKRDAERWLALKLVAQGKHIPEVANILDHQEETIRDWVKAFNDKGREGLLYVEPEGQKKDYLI